MRSLILVAVLGCSTKSAPAPSNTAPPSPPAAADQVAAPTAPVEPAAVPAPPREEPRDLPCEPRMESWPDGHHDRYVFRDEKLELSGYKNKAGTIVIPAKYREAYPFSPHGVAAVNDTKTPFAFIDPSGKVLGRAHAMDNGPDYFQDKLARIIGKDGKVGYIDDHGTIVIPPKFDEAMPFCNGKAAVELGGKQLTIDKTGAVVTP